MATDFLMSPTVGLQTPRSTRGRASCATASTMTAMAYQTTIPWTPSHCTSTLTKMDSATRIASSRGAVPAKAIEEVATRQVKFANDAVVEAERTAKAARTAKDRHALSAASAAKVALHRARIATAAVEAFDGMPRAPLLHALCARPLCPEYATGALPDLPPASAARLVRYLSVWLEAYSGGDVAGAAGNPVDAATEPLEGIPALREVVAWAGAVIDAHFTAFAMNRGSADDTAGGDDEDSDAMATLRRAAARLQAGCASVGRVNGALVHVRDGAPLPENQGVQSSTYSIELVDW